MPECEVIEMSNGKEKDGSPGGSPGNKDKNLVQELKSKLDRHLGFN